MRLAPSDVNTSLRPTSFCLKSARKKSLSYKAIHAIGGKLSLSGSLPCRSPAAAGRELTRARQPLKPGLPTPPLEPITELSLEAQAGAQPLWWHKVEDPKALRNSRTRLASKRLPPNLASSLLHEKPDWPQDLALLTQPPPHTPSHRQSPNRTLTCLNSSW